jgi:hypothetical protein
MHLYHQIIPKLSQGHLMDKFLFGISNKMQGHLNSLTIKDVLIPLFFQMIVK